MTHSSRRFHHLDAFHIEVPPCPSFMLGLTRSGIQKTAGPRFLAVLAHQQPDKTRVRTGSGVMASDVAKKSESISDLKPCFEALSRPVGIEGLPSGRIDRQERSSGHRAASRGRDEPHHGAPTAATGPCPDSPIEPADARNPARSSPRMAHTETRFSSLRTGLSEARVGATDH